MARYRYVLGFLIFCLLSCKAHKVHHAKFYKKLGNEAEKDGFHANETNRVLDFKEENKNAHESEIQENKEETSKNLKKLNKPNTYNSKVQKTKKKRFSFYM